MTAFEGSFPNPHAEFHVAVGEEEVDNSALGGDASGDGVVVLVVEHHGEVLVIVVGCTWVLRTRFDFEGLFEIFKERIKYPNKSLKLKYLLITIGHFIPLRL